MSDHTSSESSPGAPPSPAAEPAEGAETDASEADAGDVDERISAAQAAMEDARRRVVEAPAEVIVVNHVMGLYELAAIHLSSPAPDLRAASLAIDAVAYLVEGLGDRLGSESATMRDALTNIRLAFVQIKNRPAPAADDASASS